MVIVTALHSHVRPFHPRPGLYERSEISLTLKGDFKMSVASQSELLCKKNVFGVLEKAGRVTRRHIIPLTN